MTDETDSVSKASMRLARVQAEYNTADACYRSASIARSTALNALNDAQKAFDEAVNAIKKEAPLGTDWKTVKGLPV